MGVEHITDTDGDAPLELRCDDCDETFWTDETMANDCPHCGSVSMNPA